eukprot:TRINITY_DN8984_c0_g1_i3.p1 TRINITY_DN8984_c0_g1~~TRINITY_DN8984_c0_g1_i3.p1  ORF type:complete len:174 (+),score=30.82 TRINITY_DN8984_c0_g1_i3:118-639(+)
MRRGDRGGFRGGFRGRRGWQESTGPPKEVVELGEFTHACEGFMICKALGQDVPLINRHVFNKDKNKIGIVDEIFGPINSYGFAVKLEEGVKAESFKPGCKVYTDPYSLRPVSFFLPKPKASKDANGQRKGPGIARGPNAIAKRGNFRGAARGLPRGAFRTRPRSFSRGNVRRE